MKSNVLMEVELDVVSYDKCFDGIREFLLALSPATDDKAITDGEVSQVLEGMVCAYREGNDLCNGDQGGPLIVKDESGEDNIQVGIAVQPFCGESFVAVSGPVPVPGLYFSVGDIYEWINMYIISSPSPSEHVTPFPSSSPVILEDPDDDKTDNACEDGDFVCFFIQFFYFFVGFLEDVFSIVG